MQPQNNDFPLDKISSSPTGGAGSADPGQTGGSATEPATSPMVGGTTFTPQSAPADMPNQPVVPEPAPTTPSWQQDAQNDAAQVYAADQSGGVVPPSTPPVSSAAAMNQDFSSAANPGAPTPPPNPAEPPVFEPPASTTPTPVTPEPLSPIDSQPTASTTPPIPESTLTPQPNPAPTPTTANTLDLSSVAGAQTTPPPPHESDVHPAEPAGLPGAEQLSAASAGLDQNQPPSADPMMDPMLADSSNMGSYGPPPNNKKKLILIIVGVVLGLVLIGVLILVLTRSAAKKPAVNLSQEQPQQQPAQPVTQPTSGPATPPQGYVTIEKQCFSFAMYEKNTVPTDQVCSFANATFGKLGVSKVSVATGTETYNSLDDFVGKVKPTLSVTNDEAIKLDGVDARKITYKASDAKSYVKVLALVTGRNYQQDGKKVTNVDITSSYGEDFDKQVTNTMLDTWRWK